MLNVSAVVCVIRPDHSLTATARLHRFAKDVPVDSLEVGDLCSQEPDKRPNCCLYFVNLLVVIAMVSAPKLDQGLTTFLVVAYCHNPMRPHYTHFSLKF